LHRDGQLADADPPPHQAFRVNVSRKLSAQLGIIGSGVLIGLVCRFVQSAALARLLGVEEFGKYATLVALMAIVSRLNDLGLPSVVAYYFRRTPGSFASLMRIVRLDFVWCCAASLVVAGVAAHLPLAIADDFRGAWVLQVGLAAYIAVNTPTWILPGFISAAGDYSSYARFTNLDAALQAVLAVGSCLVFGPSYIHVLGALTVEQALMSGIYLRFLRRYRSGGPKVEIPMRETLSYGLRLHWGMLMKLLSSRADILTVGALTNPALAGLYSVALNVRDIGLLPHAVYAAPFQNLVIDRSLVGDASDRSPVLRGLFLQMALSLAMAIGAGIALPVLIPAVYGAAFRAAVVPAVVLFASVIFLGPAGLCWMAFNAKGRPDFTSLVLTTSGIAGPVLTYFLISNGHSLTAAAGGSFLVSGVTFALSIVLLQRIQRYRGAEIRDALTRAVLTATRVAADVRAYVGRLVRPLS
jgi:O-antigen/teichoic acid export membrane protein